MSFSMQGALDSISISLGAGGGVAVTGEDPGEQGNDFFFFSEGGIQSSVLYSECCAIFWNGTLVC